MRKQRLEKIEEAARRRRAGTVAHVYCDDWQGDRTNEATPEQQAAASIVIRHEYAKNWRGR